MCFLDFAFNLVCVRSAVCLLRVAGVNVPPEAALSSTRRSSPAVGEKCTALGCSPLWGQVVTRYGASQKCMPGGLVLWPGR